MEGSESANKLKVIILSSCPSATGILSLIIRRWFLLQLGNNKRMSWIQGAVSDSACALGISMDFKDKRSLGLFFNYRVRKVPRDNKCDIGADTNWLQQSGMVEKVTGASSQWTIMMENCSRDSKRVISSGRVNVVYEVGEKNSRLDIYKVFQIRFPLIQFNCKW